MVQENSQEALKYTELKTTLREGFVTYVVSLGTPVRAGVKSFITVEEVYTHLKTPFPKTMKITDTPRIRVTDDAYY